MAKEYISKELGISLKDIRENPGRNLALIKHLHARTRRVFGLPEAPPRALDGVKCNICVNECRIPENGVGYCGLRRNEGGKLKGGDFRKGALSWYYDSLPTNCVADWVCAGGTGAGYPKYSYSPGPEIGYKNLAVFFHACSFNCLYCQNYHFRERSLRKNFYTPYDLVSDIDDKTSCICYFGGDPTPQLPFAIKASRLALEENKGRILRICWETNGSMHEGLLERMIELSLDSGGCIKFDLKAWNEDLHFALTGASNKRTLQNFKRVGERFHLRPNPPLLIASTLLVPGYIDEEEVRSIARFIASINPEIPYSLLAFYPCFYMGDLPSTPRALAQRCFEIAKEEGLKNVRIGNVHLLW